MSAGEIPVCSGGVGGSIPPHVPRAMEFVLQDGSIAIYRCACGSWRELHAVGGGPVESLRTVFRVGSPRKSERTSPRLWPRRAPAPSAEAATMVAVSAVLLPDSEFIEPPDDDEPVPLAAADWRVYSAMRDGEMLSYGTNGPKTKLPKDAELSSDGQWAELWRNGKLVASYVNLGRPGR